MSDPVFLIQVLRGGTRAHHDRVEAVGFGKELMGGSITMDQYRQLIRAQAAVHALLEPDLLPFGIPAAGENEPSPYTYQPRSPSLSRDLAALNLLPPPTGAITPPLPPHRQLARAYVLEGASLGGSAIYRALQRHPNIQFNPEIMQFYAFQARTGRQQWAALLPLLRETRVGEEQAAEALAEARGVFELFVIALTGAIS